MEEQAKERHTINNSRQVSIIEDIDMGISRESLAPKPEQKENDNATSN